MKSLGFTDLEFVPAIGRFGGLILCGQLDIHTHIILANNNVIHCTIQRSTTDDPWHFSAIYAPPYPSDRARFWEVLLDIGHSVQGPWCLLGDFNCVLETHDKQGGRPVASSSSNGLRRVVDTFGLINIGFHGKKFTWNNRRGGLANIQE